MTARFTIAITIAMGVCMLWGCGGTRPDIVGKGFGPLAPCPGTPNCVHTTATDSTHAIAPYRYADSLQSAVERLARTIQALPRTNIVTRSESYLYAEFTSKIMRYVDDVEFVFDDSTKAVHFRSASRLGKSDLGVNRARMEQIRRLFEPSPASEPVK